MNFFWSCRLKRTGSIDTMAKTANIRIELREKVSLDEVSWLRVVPAWMATNDGGATPINKFQWMKYEFGCKENAEFTKKSSYKEGHQWDPYHWGSDVDEPIGQEWRDTQENDVVEQVVLMFLDL